jgi:predicted metal-dependent enzyme (double-stranded beta helix superfamily)
VSTTMQSVTASGRLLGARQLASVVQRVADSQAEWLTRVRLNPAGRWYEQIHLDDSHEVWLISWLPGQETGFHNHGGASGAFTVALGTLLESRVTRTGHTAGVGDTVATISQMVSKPVGAGGVRSFGPRYIHNVRNASAASVAVSVHAYSPPLSAMTRYELTQSGLVTLGTEPATAWSAA